MPASPLPLATPPRIPPGVRIGRYRWMICALLFFATTINYVDRNSLSRPEDHASSEQMNWSEADYGWIRSRSRRRMRRFRPSSGA